MHRSRRLGLLGRAGTIALTAAVLLACSSTPPTAAPGGTGAGTTERSRPRATADPSATGTTGNAEVRPVADASRCEFFTDECLLPFPSNRFTTADPAAATGRRVSLQAASMPANLAGVHVDPTEWNRQDGFSPGSVIITKVAGIDLERSRAAGVNDIGRSLAEDSPIVLLDADTGERVPHWAELDAQQHLEEAKAGPDRRALLIRPARNFPDGHRVVVALRHLVDATGAPIAADPVFAAYRDRQKTPQPEVEARRPDMEDTFAQLTAAGVARDQLFLAWSFTVASTKNLTERMLFMRDDAFGQLGDAAPSFTILKTTEHPATGVLRLVEGTIDVPNYLTNHGEPGSVLNNGTDPNGLPVRDGVYKANVLCIVPTTAEQQPAGAIVYGHGLLGSASEVKAVGTAVGATHNVITCATDEIGMSSRDTGPIANVLSDLSGFRMLPDRLQQGLLDELFLGRALVHAKGLRTDKAFRSAAGTSLLADQLEYVGNSQGGILGGAASAVAQDWDRAFLGVPGMNYSTLLNRSVDFDRYAVLMRAQYPDPLAQQELLALLQMLWDRGENDGYANHLTHDPLPGTKAKTVLLLGAFGDHQVTNVATDVLARTIDARVRQPALAPGRSTDVHPFWGIDAVPAFPTRDSVYVMWDFGTPAPPLTNTPNREGDDPHGKGSAVPAVIDLAVRFVLTGEVIDPCPGGPCHTP